MNDLRVTLIEVLNKALIPEPVWWRMKIIKWIFPDIIKIAKALQDYLWADHCPLCGSTDVNNLKTCQWCRTCK